ncbi:uncharacterized protein LOC130988152 [Salvia miltiorrhiza]|uniref:uncharacterized protein LOC130988152 n=1 Tax=Salvia miltiorrhiza TaxID=226208 RepID=UPI0025AC8325|nr:uncharacterized protein LOC130988152 [Salvia miltiorrhiza]
MDWYAWLSQTNLDASLIYEYGLALVRNEVGEEDLPYFNHDFLQSLGISVARHRLEILKLCAGRSGLSLSRLVLVMNNTRKLFARKLGFRRNPPPQEVSPYRSRRNVMWSGPLDRRFMDFKMHPNWSPMPRQRQRPGHCLSQPGFVRAYG